MFSMMWPSSLLTICLIPKHFLPQSFKQKGLKNTAKKFSLVNFFTGKRIQEINKILQSSSTVLFILSNFPNHLLTFLFLTLFNILKHSVKCDILILIIFFCSLAKLKELKLLQRSAIAEVYSETMNPKIGIVCPLE